MGELMRCDDDPEVKAAMANAFKQMRERESRLKAEREAGEAALRRLLPIAQGNSGQCRVVAAVLLSLYNGSRFPLRPFELRGLDTAIFEDVLAVLRMDANAYQEVHCYFENGGEIFEALAVDWGFVDGGGV